MYSLTVLLDDRLASVVGLIVGAGLEVLGLPALLHRVALALVANQVVFAGAY